MFDTPGVYVREIPSGNRPIAGVATSTTAFVCVTQRGPVNRAVRVTSYGEFERIYGGLMDGTEVTYAVRNYFLNGGSVAFIVRVTAGEGGDAPAAATQDVPVLTPAATTTITTTIMPKSMLDTTMETRMPATIMAKNRQATMTMQITTAMTMAPLTPTPGRASTMP